MIVFESSPLILLAKAELLEPFLDALPDEVAVPPAVRAECCDKKRSFDAHVIRALIEGGRISVVKPGSRKAYERLRRDFNLGMGEAQAIALAHTTDTRLIVIEDRNGVNACKLLKLSFAGVLGILVRMREKKLISREEAVRKLEILTGLGRYGAGIIEDVRRRLESKR